MTTLVCHWVCLILTVAAVTVQSSSDLEGQPYKYRPVSTFLNIIKRAENYCAEGDWWCPTDNWCMDPRVRCDLIKQCDDGSDERNCDSCRTKEDYYLCEADRKCIPLSWTCNGIEQCSDGADERQCENPGEDMCQLAVKAGFCSVSSVHSNWVFRYCYQHCPKRGRNCAIYKHSCDRATKCLWNFKVCDGRAHCDDGTDEENCVPLPGNKCKLWALVGFCGTTSKHYNYVAHWCSGCVPFVSDGSEG